MNSYLFIVGPAGVEKNIFEFIGTTKSGDRSNISDTNSTIAAKLFQEILE